MDDVSCIGTEIDIKDCPHSDSVNCDENEGAGVVCRGTLSRFFISQNNIM